LTSDDALRNDFALLRLYLLNTSWLPKGENGLLATLDRIEARVRKLERHHRRNESKQQRARADAAEERLAQALEILREIEESADPWCEGHCGDTARDALTRLGETKEAA